jgi:hypothetical protein
MKFHGFGYIILNANAVQVCPLSFELQLRSLYAKD